MIGVPPNNQDAEKSVLGAMFLDREALEDATAQLIPEDFYLPAHQEIFRAMKALEISRTPVDLVTLGEELTRNNTLVAVGGYPYLTDIARHTPSAANVAGYIEIVRDKAVLRGLLAISRATDKAVADEDLEPREIIARADKALGDISDRFVADAGGDDMASILKNTYLLIESRARKDPKAIGIPTGIADLDMLMGGLLPSELTVIGARPGVGKSAIVLSIAKNVACRGVPVLIFSREMSQTQLGERLFANLTGINSRKFRTGNVGEIEYTRLAQALADGSQLPIYIDTVSRTPGEIRARCRKQAKSPGGLGLVIVDYLQLLHPDQKGDAKNREQLVSGLSAAMKDLSTEFDTPVIEVAQLNRQSVTGRSKPSLGEFRESGAIEQDANNALLLYEPKPGEDGFTHEMHQELERSGMRMINVIVAKARSGETGMVNTAFHPATSRFTSLAKGAAS